LAAHQSVARKLQERRLEERQKQHDMENTLPVSAELRARVLRAVGPVKSVEKYVDEQIERRVLDRQQELRKTVSEKRGDLKRMQEKVNRRPLLMEQTDSLARARRRALFQFRKVLQDAGNRDPDAIFDDEELDELNRARQDRDFASGD
jgi:hypothetical protein